MEPEDPTYASTMRPASQLPAPSMNDRLYGLQDNLTSVYHRMGSIYERLFGQRPEEASQPEVSTCV